MIYSGQHNYNQSKFLGTSKEDVDYGSQRSDRFLLVCVVGLISIGILSVYSAIAFFAESNATTPIRFVFNHILKIVMAVIVMLIVSKINYRTLAKFSKLAMLISWSLLIAVLFVGTTQFGAKRWLDLGLFSFQPSSFATVALILHISVLLSEKQAYIKDYKKAFLPILLWVIITCGLIGLHDFSSAAILLVVCLIMMVVAGINLMHISTLVIIAVIGGGLILSQSDARSSRLTEYVKHIKNIETTEILRGKGYQAQQAQIAIAKGEITGVGMGNSSQRDFLPAPYNDFIYAIIAEEYGLLGGIAIILAFTLILIRGIAFIARRAKDNLGTIMAIGFTLIIVLFAYVNAGVASGLLPVTGLPMPFVSYGGTNMLFTGSMIGILLNISKHNRNQREFYNG